MTPFWTCVALFTIGLVTALIRAHRIDRDRRGWRDAAHAADDLREDAEADLRAAKRQIDAQSAAIRQRDETIARYTSRGPGGQFTGKAA